MEDPNGTAAGFESVRGTQRACIPLQHIYGARVGMMNAITCRTRGFSLVELLLAILIDALGIGQVENGLSLVTKRDALESSRQESTTPVRRTATWSARPRLEDDKSR